MSQQAYQTAKRPWFPLPVRISLGLVGAAIIPLFVMLIFTNIQTRPALIDQANKAMASDAQTRVQLIDTYFTERVRNALTLVPVPSVQEFLMLPPPPTTNTATYQTALIHAAYSLLVILYGLLRNLIDISQGKIMGEGEALAFFIFRRRADDTVPQPFDFDEHWAKRRHNLLLSALSFAALRLLDANT